MKLSCLALFFLLTAGVALGQGQREKQFCQITVYEHVTMNNASYADIGFWDGAHERVELVALNRPGAAGKNLSLVSQHLTQLLLEGWKLTTTQMTNLYNGATLITRYFLEREGEPTE